MKVLDFGLAKAFQPDAGDPGLSASPTISLTAAATQLGMVMGTAAYMSPEQARGKQVDRRADIWAFGAVLYETLTGAKPFPGDDISQTLARVIARDPDWDVLPKTLSPALDTYLRRCLQKDPRQRVRDIGDVRLALEGAFETPQQPGAASSGVSWKPLLPAALGAFVLGGVMAWVWAASGEAPSPARLESFEVTTPSDAPLQIAGGMANQPGLAIARDGSRVVYRTTENAPNTLPNGVLYVRNVGQLEATLIRGTEGALGPFFSPDGEWVAFNDTRDNTLKKVSVLGGTPADDLPVGWLPARGQLGDERYHRVRNGRQWRPATGSGGWRGTGAVDCSRSQTEKGTIGGPSCSPAVTSFSSRRGAVHPRAHALPRSLWRRAR